MLRGIMFYRDFDQVRAFFRFQPARAILRLMLELSLCAETERLVVQCWAVVVVVVMSVVVVVVASHS